jgi:sulfate-transporting ATPase
VTTAIQFAVLGLGVGAVYVLLAQGLVVIHSGSGVINFAHAALGMVGAYLYWQLHEAWGWPVAVAVPATMGALALVGVAVYQLLMRPLRHASSIARVVVTLGLLVTLQGAAALIWGLYIKNVTPFLPQRVFTVRGVVVPIDRLWLLGIAVGTTLLLWAAYRFTPLGLAIRAGAQNGRAAASLGWSPHVLASVAWGVGSALAALAGILISPLLGLGLDEFPLLVIPVLAAALLGGFESLLLTLVGGILIGVVQSLTPQYVHIQGASWAVPFLLIVLILVVRGKGLPTRGLFAERLPRLGTGVVRWRWVIPVTAAAAVLILEAFPTRLVDAITVSLAWGVIMLSVVVLLGFTSQLSFEQMAMAGLATVIAARLVADLDWPFELAMVGAVVAAVPIGALFAGPALRTRGVSLAVVTLGLAAVVYQCVLTNGDYIGGLEGTPVGPQHFLGIDLDPVRFADRYAVFVLVFFVLCAIVVANVRRGSPGSALVAVRTNERAAAALGISVFRTKLFAFVLGASIAAIGGVLLAFRHEVILYSEFDPFQSLLVVSYAIIGGVGFALGPVQGMPLVAGGLGAWILDQFYHVTTATQWLVLIGGISVMLIVVLHPDGIVEVQVGWAKQLGRWWQLGRGRLPLRARLPEPGDVLPPPGPVTVRPALLEVRGVTVRFGGVVAVDAVSLAVQPGEVVGLIGPNGAGKTTLIDAISGFVRPAAGEVALDERRIDGWPAHRRVLAGVSRSFQGLELFEDSTVGDNLRVASVRHEIWPYLRELVAPRRSPLSAAAAGAVREFRLEHELDQEVSQLPYGQRRLTAIARAIAVNPSVLLLDEPAAGLAGAEVAELATVVRRLAGEWGMAVLVVEHDMSFVMGVCDRIVVLDFGRCIASGTPAEVRADPAVVAAYLGEPDAEAAVVGSAPA